METLSEISKIVTGNYVHRDVFIIVKIFKRHGLNKRCLRPDNIDETAHKHFVRLCTDLGRLMSLQLSHTLNIRDIIRPGHKVCVKESTTSITVTKESEMRVQLRIFTTALAILSVWACHLN